MQIELYHYWRSSSSWRVRWGLEIKKVPYSVRPINLLAEEEQEEAYSQLNPSSYLPCLVVDGVSLGESIAILEWLEETYPEPALLPGDANHRARIRQLAETINSGTQPIQNFGVLKKLSQDKEEQRSWGRFWIERGLRTYERLLCLYQPEGAKFSLGNEPSLADLCLIPQCFNAGRFNVDLRQFPRIEAINKYALTTAACKAAAPENFQPKD